MSGTRGIGPFYELCQVATGRRVDLSAAPDEPLWRSLHDESRRQALTGVLFAAVERLPAAQRPPRGILLSWYGEARRVEADNARLDRATVAVSERLKEMGLRSVALKGQGAARRYPKPSLRVCGDVDIWVDGPRWAVLRRLAREGGVGHVTYHHADWHIAAGAEVEVHSRPTWMYSPRLNRRLQRWFAREAPRQFGETPQLLIGPDGQAVGEVHVPTASFDLVYQLVHLFRHTLFEGVGLRQLMDYYYTLVQPLGEAERAGAVGMIRHLGLTKFAAAVMHVEAQVFGLPAERMLIAPDARRGEYLLADVMRGGNFGQYGNAQGWPARLQRVLAFTCQYPEEALSALPFKLWHGLWRATANLRARRLSRG